MFPKWAKKAHFGNISYNVFNRRKSSYYMLETLCFTICSRMDNSNENNSQKFIIVVYIENTDKNLSAWFWCYRVYISASNI